MATGSVNDCVLAQMKSPLPTVNPKYISALTIETTDGISARDERNIEWPSAWEAEALYPKFGATVTPRIDPADKTILLKFKSTVTGNSDLLLHVRNGETIMIKGKSAKDFDSLIMLAVTPMVLPERIPPF